MLFNIKLNVTRTSVLKITRKMVYIKKVVQLHFFLTYVPVKNAGVCIGYYLKNDSTWVLGGVVPIQLWF